MRMGIAEKQNIAVQHAYFNRHGGRTQRQNPMSFKEWLLDGIAHYKKQGFTFEQVDRYTMKIIPPGKPAIIRTCADFKEEWENEYLSKF
jgi:hypothetical protein